MNELPRRQRLIAYFFLAFFVTGYCLWCLEYLQQKSIWRKNEMFMMASPGNFITVDITGAIHKPGVYKIAEGSRVFELIKIAGGAKPDAAVECLNMAEGLLDGRQIYLPTRQEYEGYRREFLSAASITSHSSTKSGPENTNPPRIPKPAEINTFIQQKIKINEATLEDLMSLPGIGPAIARRIIEYRTKNGPFSEVKDLLKVKGIGPKKLEKLENMVTIS